MSSIEKNNQIIKDELVEQMNIGLGHVNKLLGRIFGNGLSGLILNPIAKLIYKIMLSDDIRKKTKNQIDIVLECANLFNKKLNGGGIESPSKEDVLNSIINEYFEDYRQNDQSFHHCKKKHRVYPKIELMMKEVFKSRIEPANQLLISNGNTYDELARHAFSKEEALANLDREFKATAEMLELLKENMDVLDVPYFIRKRIIEIMVKAFEMTKKQLYSRIDEIFNEYS
ncbi:MAG: hypothetical protein ACTSPY_09190 [Candidatus Helarchaeota archaeon]